MAALVRLAVTADFWRTVAASLGRVLLGLMLGTALALPLTALTLRSRWCGAVISPMMTVIRCTPVASFIMLLWLLAGRDAVPQVIALLMVLPVLWQALRDGWAHRDRELSELLTVFDAGGLRRLRLLVLPTLRVPFLTGLSTAAGLAWKSGIAAEIIAYTSCSVGRKISDARNLFEGPEMMAWTVCVVLLSLLLDRAIRLLSDRLKGGAGHD